MGKEEGWQDEQSCPPCMDSVTFGLGPGAAHKSYTFKHRPGCLALTKLPGLSSALLQCCLLCGLIGPTCN